MPIGPGEIYIFARGFALEGTLTFSRLSQALRAEFGEPPFGEGVWANAWQSATEYAAKSREWQSVGPDTIPGQNHIIEGQIDYKRQFAYTLRYQGTNIVTGDAESGYAIVTSDNLISKQDAIDELIRRNQVGESLTTLGDVSADAIAVERSGAIRAALFLGTQQPFGLEETL